MKSAVVDVPMGTSRVVAKCVHAKRGDRYGGRIRVAVVLKGEDDEMELTGLGEKVAIHMVAMAKKDINGRSRLMSIDMGWMKRERFVGTTNSWD